jgi:hypothetical protein
MPVRSAVCVSVPIQAIQPSFLLNSQHIRTSTRLRQGSRLTHDGSLFSQSTLAALLAFASKSHSALMQLFLSHRSLLEARVADIALQKEKGKQLKGGTSTAPRGCRQEVRAF